MKTPVIDFFIYKEDYYDLEYGKLAYNELLTLINNLGYFVSGKKELSTIINIVIMPKFLYEVTDKIYKEDGTTPSLVKHEQVQEPIRHYTLMNHNHNYIANGCLSGTREMRKIKVEDLKPVDID